MNTFSRANTLREPATHSDQFDWIPVLVLLLACQALYDNSGVRDTI